MHKMHKKKGRLIQFFHFIPLKKNHCKFNSTIYIYIYIYTSVHSLELKSFFGVYIQVESWYNE